MVRQVALNLLLNACNATPTGGAISFEAAAGVTSLCITVRDEGPGLGSAALDVLLGRDDRLPHAASGSGLGLWMVRQLIDETAGNVSVEALETRRHMYPRHYPLRPQRRVSPMSLDGRTIAVVEDDPIMGKSLVERLSLEGARVHWWQTRRAAEAGLERTLPDLVVCDIRLPDGTGEDVFRTASSIPIRRPSSS